MDINHTHMDAYHVFVLNILFKKFAGSHYPTELVKLIIMSLHKPIQASAGWAHTVLICDKTTYVWGSNESGQLWCRSYNCFD